MHPAPCRHRHRLLPAQGQSRESGCLPCPCQRPLEANDRHQPANACAGSSLEDERKQQHFSEICPRQLQRRCTKQNPQRTDPLKDQQHPRAGEGGIGAPLPTHRGTRLSQCPRNHIGRDAMPGSGCPKYEKIDLRMVALASAQCVADSKGRSLFRTCISTHTQHKSGRNKPRQTAACRGRTRASSICGGSPSITGVLSHWQWQCGHPADLRRILTMSVTERSRPGHEFSNPPSTTSRRTGRLVRRPSTLIACR